VLAQLSLAALDRQRLASQPRLRAWGPARTSPAATRQVGYSTTNISAVYQQNISFLSGLCSLRSVPSSAIAWALC